MPFHLVIYHFHQNRRLKTGVCHYFRCKSKNMRLFSLIVLVISYHNLSSQSITGSVIDEKSQPIFFATVALYNAEDSTIIDGVSTDMDGSFRIDDSFHSARFLTVSFLGYEDVTLSDIESGGEYVVQLLPAANMLSTIEIKGKAPLLEQRGDKLIVNVSDNITNTSGNLLDVMKKVPGMLVIRDRLSLAGSGSPTILLNGKTTQYMDVQSLLRDMPGDNIQKVEIIHQPGAEYEAAGSGPIINIILKKNSLFGTNGSVSVGVGRGEIWDYNTGLNLSHYQGKLNVSGGIGYSKNAWVERLSITRRLVGIGENIDGEYVQTNFDQAQPDTYRANFRVDYDLTDRHRIGIASKAYSNTNVYATTTDTHIDLYNESVQDYTLDSRNDIDRSWNYRSINPYYIFEIDTSGQKLELDVSMADYTSVNGSTLTANFSNDADPSVQRYNQPGDTKIFATTLDYTKPLSKSIELKTGAKYSDASLDNNLASELLVGTTWVNNPLQSNHYLFDERIKAVYAKLQWNAAKWSGTAGLRYEDSQSIGNSLTLDSIQTRDIERFFPSLSLSRSITKQLKATLTYSKRINRPRYSSLNPFLFYLDPFTSDRGNPNLRPQLTDSGKFTLTFEGQPFFNVEYKQSTDAIVEVTEQENSREAFKIDVNFEKQTQFSTSLFFPLDFIPATSGYGGVIVSKNDYDSAYLGSNFVDGSWNTTAFIQAELELPWEISAELGGWFTSGNQEGIFNSEYLYGTSFGLSRKFLDRKLQVNLGVEDFVNRFWHANVDFQQDMDLVVSWQAPVVNMKVSYKFGNQHLKSKTKTKTSASDELRRATQG